jgi:abhydrolase domain-containing protein 17
MGQGLYKSLVFLPPETHYSVETIPSLRFVEHDGNRTPVYIATPSGALASDADLAQAQRTPLCIVYSHGNAESLAEMTQLVDEMSSELRQVVVCYDYGGYGQASGESSEQRCYDDVRSVFEFVVGTLAFDEAQIVLYGRSLGSGPTVDLASRLCKRGVRLAGVVLQSPIASCIRVISVAASYLAVDMFKNFRKIGNVDRPLLIVHGVDDLVVPFANGDALRQRATNLWRFVPIENAGHNDIELRHWPTFIGHCTEFINFLIDEQDGHQDVGEAASSSSSSPSSSQQRGASVVHDISIDSDDDSDE